MDERLVSDLARPMLARGPSIALSVAATIFVSVAEEATRETKLLLLEAMERVGEAISRRLRAQSDKAKS